SVPHGMGRAAAVRARLDSRGAYRRRIRVDCGTDGGRRPLRDDRARAASVASRQSPVPSRPRDLKLVTRDSGWVAGPPRAEYERRLASWRARIEALDRANLLISNTRLAIAAAGAVLLWQAFVRARISPWWPIGAWSAFAALAVYHALMLQRSERARRAADVYDRGLERLAHRWMGSGRDGARFLDDHP